MLNKLLSMQICKEEKLLIKVIFSDYKVLKKDLNKINLKILIKILSQHLIIPTFYYKIRQKNLLELFPIDFIDYISQIYDINKNRNKVLIEELHFIEDLFKSNSKKIIFLKGSSFLLNKYYSDPGVRMIGDIDFLIQEKDKLGIEKILEEKGYEKMSDYDFFPYRHLIRRINKKKLFAIEPHLYLTDRKIINPKEIFDTKKNSVNTPSDIYMLKHNIYNFMINDSGNKKLNYSYRNIYDTYVLLERGVHLIDKNEKYINNYSIIMKNLGIKKKVIPQIQKNLFYYKFKFLRKNKKIYKIYLNYSKTYEKIYEIIKKLMMVFKNKKYRKYLSKKVSSQSFLTN